MKNFTRVFFFFQVVISEEKDMSILKINSHLLPIIRLYLIELVKNLSVV